MVALPQSMPAKETPPAPTADIVMDDTTSCHTITSLEQRLCDLQAELAASRIEAGRIRHDLGERVKELSCLYKVSSILQREWPTPRVMSEVVACLVPAWQFPEIASARIRNGADTYTSAAFAESPWRQCAPLLLDDSLVGAVEVFYREARPDAGEGPFLLEERRLIDAVAELLSRHLERRAAEEALWTSERKYRTLIENLYEGVWVADANNNATFLNQRMAELLGYPAAEVMGRNVFSFLDREDQVAGPRFIRERAIREVEFTRKDGSRFWARVASTPLFDDEGRYQGALAGVVDITERKQIEARFHRQAAELETIYWGAPVGLAVLDREMRFLRVNRRLAEINGVPAEAHIGRTLAELFPGIAPQAEPVHRRIIETGEPVLEIEFHARTPCEPGTGRHWKADWLPLRDTGGNIWGINVVLEEITERKRWEEDLYRRQQEFEALVERSPDIVARVDRDWRFLYINSAVAHTTGLAREWFLGKSIDDLPLSTANKALRRRAVEDVFTTHLEQTLEHAFETPAGMRYFHARLVPEVSRTGAVQSVLVVDRDITDLKRVQHELEQLTLHDPLTGVANRRYLEQFITREWRRGTRHRYPIALIMVDIDHFKEYNDHHGHPQGDECLREVAHALETHLHRPTDLLVRYGGEEFLVILPETSCSEARRLAEGMRQAVAGIVLPHASSPQWPAAVTASFGVVAAPAHACSFTDLMTRADQALYRAKQAGRNRIEGMEE